MLKTNDEKSLLWHFFYGVGVGVKCISFAVMFGIFCGAFFGFAVWTFNAILNLL